MASGVRFFIKRFLLTIYIVIIIFFLWACLSSYLRPQEWWPFSPLRLVFPILLVIVILFFIFWLFVKPKFAILAGLSLLIGWKNTSRLFALNKPHRFIYTKKQDELRIVSWNVARFIELKRNSNKGSEKRIEMMELLKKQNADVLCLQEFHTSIDPDYYNNLKYVQQELKYPWFYFSYEIDTKDHWYSSIIFSRWPIVDTGKIRYPKPETTKVLLHADIKFGKDTVRIYNTHLHSVLFKKMDYDKIESIQHGDDGMIKDSRSLFLKLKRASDVRSKQADIVNEQIKSSKYPVLFAGDVNDVPTSYTYSTIRGNMQDAFLKKGFGIGRTFASLSPTLRIDYIFADNNFTVQQFTKYVRNLSDHYMIVADVKLK